VKTLLTLAFLVLASQATAETIYKYRGANGRLIYSNKPVPGATLIESYERQASPPVTQQGPSESDRQGEERIRQRLTTMDAAWKEVQDSGRALAEAEARLAAGIGPEAGDVSARGGPELPPGPKEEPPPAKTPEPMKVPPGKAGAEFPGQPRPVPAEKQNRPADAVFPSPAKPAPPASEGGGPEVGGPLPPASPALGGPQLAAPPAVGGPMASRRGGGTNAAYRVRIAELEAALKAARARNEAAWRAYNELR